MAIVVVPILMIDIEGIMVLTRVDSQHHRHCADKARIEYSPLQCHTRLVKSTVYMFEFIGTYFNFVHDEPSHK